MSADSNPEPNATYLPITTDDEKPIVSDVQTLLTRVFPNEAARQMVLNMGDYASRDYWLARWARLRESHHRRGRLMSQTMRDLDEQLAKVAELTERLRVCEQGRTVERAEFETRVASQSSQVQKLSEQLAEARREREHAERLTFLVDLLRSR